MVVDCRWFNFHWKNILRVLLADAEGSYFTGHYEQDGIERFIHRATVRFSLPEIETSETFYGQKGEGVIATVVTNLTEWQYPLPRYKAPTIEVRIETMDPLNNS